MAKKETVASDGLHKAIKTTITVTDGAKHGDIAQLFPGRTLEGAIGAAENYWRGVPVEPDPQPLSKAWYSRQILQEIKRLRNIAALQAGAEPIKRDRIEGWLVDALNLGSLIEEATWRFGVGDVARAGAKVRAARHVGGRTRGAQLAQATTDIDAAVAKHYRRWKMSDELQSDYRSAATYVQTKTRIARRRIERSILRIQAPKSRQ